jgi:S1-C subfamily serine protease
MQYSCKYCSTINNIEEGKEAFCSGCGRTPKEVSAKGEVQNLEAGTVVYEQNLKSVIEVHQKGSCGTGFIISEKGYAVTNQHVVWNEENKAFAKELFMSFKDSRIAYPMEIVDADFARDVALLAFDKNMVKDFKAVTCADYSTVRPGNAIYIIGNTSGGGINICSGIVREIKKHGRGGYDLTTDAPSNKGDSGSPVFNVKGEVIGIHKAAASSFVEGQAEDGRLSVDVTRNISLETPIDEVIRLIEKWEKKHRLIIL